jgi:hypothetical protein
VLACGNQRSNHCLQRDRGAVIVNRPDIQLLVLVQTFIDLGVSVTACDNPLANVLDATRAGEDGYESGTSTYTLVEMIPSSRSLEGFANTDTAHRIV